MKYYINIGDKILDWTVLDNTPIKMGSAYKIKCQCKCGTIKFVNKSCLIRQGYPKNCGCDKEPHTTYRNKELKKELEGKIFYNFYGTPMKVIEYKNSSNVLIEFQDEHKFRKTVHISNLKRQNVSNPYDKNCCGVGYYGFDYMPTNKEMGKEWNYCYNTWIGMLQRCYDSKFQLNHPTYIGCSVCEEWHSFKNFSEWFFENVKAIKDYNGKFCLDKDILYKDNKIYSPDTCCIVPNEINMLFVRNKSQRTNLPIGVQKQKNKYKVLFSVNGKNKSFCGFSTPYEAFKKYKEEKEKLVKATADKYKDLIPDKVYKAMYDYQVEITD